MNYVRTAVLLAAMTGLFLAVGFVIGGEAGMLVWSPLRSQQR